MFNLPGIILSISLLLIGIHFLVGSMDARSHIDLVFRYGFVPAAWSVWLMPEMLESVLRDAVAGGGAGLAVARYALTEAGASPWSAVTYAFLHGSWMHVLLNVFWLAAFGTPVARRLGTARFLIFCAATAVGGSMAHWVTHLQDVVPMIGASGVVSGAMGAAAWFAFSSGRGGGLIDPSARFRPRQTLSSLLRNRQVLVFFGIWFALNVLIGVSAAPLGLTDGGIAWIAHIGGFLAGLAVFPLLDPVPRPRAA